MAGRSPADAALSDPPVRRAGAMLAVTLGCLWIALTGGCTLVFFGWSGLSFLHDQIPNRSDPYALGGDVLVLVGSVILGAVGTAPGMVALWAGLRGLEEGRPSSGWTARVWLLTGALWIVMGVLAAGATVTKTIRDGEAFDPANAGELIIALVLVLGPGALLLWLGALDLRRKATS